MRLGKKRSQIVKAEKNAHCTTCSKSLRAGEAAVPLKAGRLDVRGLPVVDHEDDLLRVRTAAWRKPKCGKIQITAGYQ